MPGPGAPEQVTQRGRLALSSTNVGDLKSGLGAQGRPAAGAGASSGSKNRRHAVGRGGHRAAGAWVLGETEGLPRPYGPQPPLPWTSARGLGPPMPHKHAQPKPLAPQAAALLCTGALPKTYSRELSPCLCPGEPPDPSSHCSRV